MTTTQASYPQLNTAQHQSFALRMLRAEFEAMPPKLKAARLAYVQRLLDDERRRGQLQPSYLMQHATEIYGIVGTGQE